MNFYGIFILSALILKFLVDGIAEWVNLRSLHPELPAGLSDLYDPEKYRKSQEYTRTGIRFGFVESSFDLSVLLIFWFSGGFNWLDHSVRGLGFGDLVSGVLYIGILFFAGGILSVPFDLYSTFVIEARYGFNRTTFRTFVLDRMKGIFITILLGCPLLAAILWFFSAIGSQAWIYCWVIVSVFGLLVQFVAPIWIMPLFNKFTPLPQGELREAIHAYAGNVGFAFRDVFVMDGSRRSSKANAFFTGFGKNKRIGLFDTLLNLHSVPEVVAVLAHEIGHYKKKHVVLMMMIGFLQMGVLFFLLAFFISSPGLYEAFYVEQSSIYGGLVFFGLLYEPFSFVLSVLMNIVSRKHELQADRYAVETIQNPSSMVSALKKLHVQNLANLTPHPFYVFLNYSHPPLIRRIESIASVAS